MDVPVEVDAEDVKMGIKREKIVIMQSENENLNGKAIRVRPLRAREYKELTGKVILKLNAPDLGSAFALQYAACKITKPSPTILTPGIQELIDDMAQSDVGQLGDAILGMSAPKEEAVEDFSKAQKGS